MAQVQPTGFASRIASRQHEILDEWIALLRRQGALQSGRITEAEFTAQCRELLTELFAALGTGGTDPASPAYARLRDWLADVSAARAVQGFTAAENATFILSVKQPIFAAIERAGDDADSIAAAIKNTTQALDALAVLTIEAYQRSREQVIVRQQQEIAELSTPVVKLWEGVLALPLIGTLDSQRTQVVMENLLQSIVDTGAEIAIIDITGVPTVDTLVAQHLLKTVAAARLMGADCIISGIRPQIAQTMVHLGVELNVVSKATLADAFALALRRTGREVVAAGSRD